MMEEKINDVLDKVGLKKQRVLKCLMNERGRTTARGL